MFDCLKRLLERRESQYDQVKRMMFPLHWDSVDYWRCYCFWRKDWSFHLLSLSIQNCCARHFCSYVVGYSAWTVCSKALSRLRHHQLWPSVLKPLVLNRHPCSVVAVVLRLLYLRMNYAADLLCVQTYAWGSYVSASHLSSSFDCHMSPHFPSINQSYWRNFMKVYLDL